MSQRLDENGVPIEDAEGTAGTEGTPNPEGTDTGDTSDSSKKPLSEDEYNKALERMRAADRAKSAAEQREADLAKRLKEYEDKDKTELERANADAEEARKEAADAKAALMQQRINNAFLTSNKHAWHNPDRALSLLDMSEVTIGDDGTVLGLDKAIEALAKSDPYLIKASESDGQDSAPGTPSGTPAGSGTGKGKPAANSRESLMDKYPALRR